MIELEARRKIRIPKHSDRRKRKRTWKYIKELLSQEKLNAANTQMICLVLISIMYVK